MQAQFAAALLQRQNTVNDNLPLSELSLSRFSYCCNNLAAIWYATLKNAYPVLHQLVGDVFFRQMATEYGYAYPSKSGDLNEFGAELPLYLATSECNADYPYFADVARLEWQLHRSYYAANAPVLSLPVFVATVASRGVNLSSAILQNHPAVSLYTSSLRGLDIWFAHQQSDAIAFPLLTELANYGLIVRQNWKPQVVRLEQTEWAVLSKLFQGESLESALDYALHHDSEFPIQISLNRWFQLEIFSEVIRFCED
ncbi:putative DNA-binding domain-containing protein [Undibacterium sp. FT147W]|uniref:DNA-binding domain-containing protein n=1 Tax=Undibacterium rivi TaxID=2828729 RepID=A0ABS5H4U2_9BURK|nr:DNA-binding domain-containing protein [Undibacterium rivi]MBR7793513.1 putative DNA-binding domain-containing protein [Undibacterium rivi]